MALRTLADQIKLDNALFYDLTAGMAKAITIAGVADLAINLTGYIESETGFDSRAVAVRVSSEKFPNVAQGQAAIFDGVTYQIQSVQPEGNTPHFILRLQR